MNPIPILLYELTSTDGCRAYAVALESDDQISMEGQDVTGRTWQFGSKGYRLAEWAEKHGMTSRCVQIEINPDIVMGHRGEGA